MRHTQRLTQFHSTGVHPKLLSALAGSLVLLTLPGCHGSSPSATGGQARASGTKVAAGKADLATISSALHQFRLDCDQYPTAQQGLEALVRSPAGLEVKWKGPYLTKHPPLDPWGKAYVYQAPAGKAPLSFTLISYGSDGAPGGRGDAADLIETSK